MDLQINVVYRCPPSYAVFQGECHSLLSVLSSSVLSWEVPMSKGSRTLLHCGKNAIGDVGVKVLYAFISTNTFSNK